MSEGKVNNITKQEALLWLRNSRNKFNAEYNARRLFEITVLGDSYEDYGRDISNLCRAYSITELGSSSNRIKGVYKKYRNNYTAEDIKNAIYTIVITYPNGIGEEHPFFENKLKKLLEQNKNHFNEAQAYYGDNRYASDFVKDSFDFNSRGNRSNISSLNKDNVLIILIIAAIITVIIFHKQIFSLIAAIIPYVLVIAVLYLIFKIAGKPKGSRKSSTRNAANTYYKPQKSSNKYYKPQKSSNKKAVSAPKMPTSGKKVIGGIAWAAMFLYAAVYYKNAGDPTHWTIIAAVIGIVGGLNIMYK